MPEIAIARSFFPALSKLEPREQGLVTAFLQKLMDEHVRSGTSLERVKRTKLANLWSARITQELRAILCLEGDSYLVLHVDHHDAAYAWAERRQLHHDAQNRLQIIETMERSVEVKVELPVNVPAPLFALQEDRYLLSLGVPESWLPAIREFRTQEQLLALCDHLPEEVVESLIDVANGEVVAPRQPALVPTLLHVDSGRRFYVVHDQDDLTRALEGSLEEWMLFLHPDQRQIVEGLYQGPMQVIGAAGTGKTVVALHRARELARRETQVLLATFTRSLAENLSRSLDRLCTSSERSRIQVSTLHSQALRLARVERPALHPLSDDDLARFVREVNAEAAGAPEDLVLSELRGVIQPKGITAWSGYRDVSRVGRGEPLRAEDRHAIWSRVSRARTAAWKQNRLDWAGICSVATRALTSGKASTPFQAVLVDEVQDLGMAELELVRALCKATPGNLMLFGDESQRIYGHRSELERAGIEVSGRVLQLRTNYRTTDAIRRAAETVIGIEHAKRSRSLLRGPAPVLKGAADVAAERELVIVQIVGWRSQGIKPEEIAVLARVEERLSPLREALLAMGIETGGLLTGTTGQVRLGTLHGAKGLEFKAVALLGCEQDTIPYRHIVQSHRDPLDREVQLEQERHLLYVGMTRAREELAITWVGTASPWIAPDEIGENNGPAQAIYHEMGVQP